MKNKSQGCYHPMERAENSAENETFDKNKHKPR